MVVANKEKGIIIQVKVGDVLCRFQRKISVFLNSSYDKLEGVDSVSVIY